MARGFVKLFESILDSSVWQQSSDTKVVWITILAMADQHGEVLASLPGLARRAGVSLESCEQALCSFLAPDPYSQNPENEGRRLQVIPGGWLVLNYAEYRYRMSIEHKRELNRIRQQRYRDRQKEKQ